MNGGITVCEYQEWMEPQVAALSLEAYGYPISQISSSITSTFKSPVQAGAQRFVALEDGNVIGQQTYMCWPLLVDGTHESVFQSGNSVVRSVARGKGVFTRLLEHTSASFTKSSPAIGFPISGSFPGLIRAGWTNPFDLVWWVKPVRRLRSSRERRFVGPHSATPVPGRVTLEGSTSFKNWQGGKHADGRETMRLSVLGGEGVVEFQYRRRLKSINEVTIGSVRVSSASSDAIRESLHEFENSLGYLDGDAFCSIAVNPLSQEWTRSLSACGFRRTTRRISFLTRNVSPGNYLPWDRWWVFRSDIDTW